MELTIFYVWGWILVELVTKKEKKKREKCEKCRPNHQKQEPRIKKFGLLKKTCLLLPSSFFGKDMKVDGCVSLFRESVV